MAASNLMDNSLLDALRTGNSNIFKRLLDSELDQPAPVTVVDIPPEPEPITDDRHTLKVPPIRSMLLRGVTSDGDRVLHIAARHGHVHLVRAILVKAGVREAELEQRQRKDQDGEEATAREQCPPPFKAADAAMKPKWLCAWSKCSGSMEDTVEGEAAPAAVAETGGHQSGGTPVMSAQGRGEAAAGMQGEEEVEAVHLLGVAAATAASSSSQHDENTAQRCGEGAETVQEDEEEECILPAPAAAVNPQCQGHDDDAAAAAAAQQGSSSTRLQFVDFLRARNNKGETCLHEAVRWGHTSIAIELIAVDGKLLHNDDDGTTNSPPLVRILDKDGASPLYLATTLRRYDIVRCLITDNKYRHRVSYAGPAGKTALHAAVLLSAGLCELLLRWDGSLAKCRDKKSGMTPLHYLGTSDTAITQLILDRDASSGYCTDAAGWLPIHAAASRGRLDVIRLLLERCPGCESRCDDAGRTFLHVAILSGHAEIVTHVCAAPGLAAHLLNVRDGNGDTALHLAVQNGLEEIFCCLFGNKGTCLSFINKEGHTPLDLAFLSIGSEDHHGFKQRKREWILNDLVVAGADFCSCRWDHFCSSGIKGPTDENESEKLSKSAGLIAAGAALILSLSFAAPVAIAGGSRRLPTPTAGAGGTMMSAQIKREESFRNLVEFDAFSLTASSLAIFCCIIAGFHTSRVWTRSVALLVGGSLLYVASVEILMVFAMGLGQVYPRRMAPRVVYFVISALNAVCFFAAISSLHLLRVLCHIQARYKRLGPRASLRSFFRLLPGVSPIPQWHILLLLALIASFIITTRYLYTSKSMKLY